MSLRDEISETVKYAKMLSDIPPNPLTDGDRLDSVAEQLASLCEQVEQLAIAVEEIDRVNK